MSSYSTKRGLRIGVAVTILLVIFSFVVPRLMSSDESKARRALEQVLAKADASGEMYLVRSLAQTQRDIASWYDPTGTNPYIQQDLYAVDEDVEEARVSLAMTYLSNRKVRLVLERLPEYAAAAEREIERRDTAAK